MLWYHVSSVLLYAKSTGLKSMGEAVDDDIIEISINKDFP